MLKKILRLLAKLSWVLWLIALVLIGARFAQKNGQQVSIDFIFWQTPETSTGVLICLAFVSGALFGVLALGPLVFWHRRKAKKLKVKNEKLNKPFAKALVNPSD